MCQHMSIPEFQGGLWIGLRTSQVALSRLTDARFRPDIMAISVFQFRNLQHSRATLMRFSMVLVRFLSSGCVQISVATQKLIYRYLLNQLNKKGMIN
jgi:hypothetical protein